MAVTTNTTNTTNTTAILTENEYKALFDGMVALLNEYDYNWTATALDSIISEWARNKADLIAAFKKHPKYVDGKFLIAFDMDYERTIDKHALREFRAWICQTCAYDCRNNLPDELRSQLRELQVIPSTIGGLLVCIDDWNTRTLNIDWAHAINKIIPEIRAKEGEKTSRVVNRLLSYLHYDKHPEYNKRYAKYADGLSPLKIKRHTILSLNPLDYLTMSFGNSWSSCHTIDKENKRNMPNGYEGQYSSGTMSYMLDGSSMVLYVVDNSYDGTDYFTQAKINRQMYHYANDKLIQGRLYPQGNDGDKGEYDKYRAIVQDIFATIMEKPNLWTTKHGYDPIVYNVRSAGTHYRDYTNFLDCSISTFKDSENNTPVHIGHDPICVYCGDWHDRRGSIDCCHDGYICADCGCYVSRDDYIEIDGEIYCRDCVNYCEWCDEYHRGESYRARNRRGYNIDICEYCAESDFTYCEDCDTYVINDCATYVESAGRCVCDSCLESGYTLCDNCGEYFPNDEINHDGYSNYCNDCITEREDEENEESEEVSE